MQTVFAHLPSFYNFLNTGFNVLKKMNFDTTPIVPWYANYVKRKKLRTVVTAVIIFNPYGDPIRGILEAR